MHYYHVYSGSKHIDLVKASTPEDACRIVNKQFGDAKQYSLNVNYYAVKA